MNLQLDPEWVQALAEAQKWVRGATNWNLEVVRASGDTCDVEIVATLEPAKGSVLWPGGPRSASVLLCSGPVSLSARDRLKESYAALQRPVYVIAFGTHAISTVTYQVCSDVVVHVDEVIPVNVYTLGFPPRPEALQDAVQQFITGLVAAHPVPERKNILEEMPAEVLQRYILQSNAPPTADEMNRDRTLADRPPL